MSRQYDIGGEAVTVGARPDASQPDGFIVTIGDRVLRVTARRAVDGSLALDLPGAASVRAVVSPDPSRAGSRWITVGARTTVIHEADVSGGGAEHGGGLEAPMPGTVLEVCVAEGDSVEAGATLLVVEAMKMEHAIKAPRAGVVARIAATEGDTVTPGTPLVVLDEVAEE